ncbi:Uncharacterised protein [Moraxella lacunata]|uniref:Neisseria meningitidis TspB protein n=1 Tax=Moraxella lacunata TaxID=477 RepID=A0A378T703_MORLA|nr:hypothetical protein [Moraxella lacunata]STZ55665.1 Uncharacterised protein [Moraxella lacunata]STZ55678.1 Uncharacterised protein [Moraxella lacunata]
MNYNRTIIITLLALLSLCSVLAHANEDFKIFTEHVNDRLNKIQKDIDKRGVTTTTQRQSGGATVTVAKNYPVVPYDPNHPNVKKQSTFNIKANAKTLAGRFARGINSAALAYAVVDLLGDGIDWVLDPNNNSIKYYHPDGYLWLDHHQKIHPSKESAANYNCQIMANNLCKSVTSIKQSSYNDSVYDVYISSDNPSITTAPSIQRIGTTKEQSMPLDTIANHVINNEDNSTTNVITNNYYNTVNETIIEQIEKGEHDNDIDTALRNVSQPDDSPSPETQPQPTPPDVAPIGREPDNTDAKPFELPAFCDWASKVCEFIDWVKQEPPEPPPPEQVPKANLSDLGLDENELFKQRVQFDGQCPKHELKFAINGKQIIEPIPTHHFCNLLEQIAPWLLAFSYLSAGFFVIRNL